MIGSWYEGEIFLFVRLLGNESKYFQNYFSLDLKIFVPHEYVSHVVHNATISNNIVFKCKFYHFSPTKAKPKLDNFAEKKLYMKIERFYIIFVLVADGIPNTKSEPGVY